MSQIKGISSPPTSDPLSDEARAIRQRISEQLGQDVDRLVEHLRELELREPGRVVLLISRQLGFLARRQPQRGVDSRGVRR